MNPALIPAVRDDWSVGLRQELTALAAAKRDIPVMFLGDSITQLWSFSASHPHRGGLEIWERELAPLGAENFGVTGDMIQDVLYRITAGGQLACNPRKIVLLIGTNNLHQLPVATPEEAVEGIDRLLAEIRIRCPEARILLLGLLPREGDYPIAAINAGLPETAARHGAEFRDFGPELAPGGMIDRAIFRDGLHLSSAGYRRLADLLLPWVRE